MISQKWSRNICAMGINYFPYIKEGDYIGICSLRETLQDITNRHTHLATLPQPQLTLQQLHQDFPYSPRTERNQVLIHHKTVANLVGTA